MKVINFFILCFVMSPIMVRAESIDCGKAKSSVERLICGNTNLSMLDENLNKIYLKSLESKSDKQGRRIASLKHSFASACKRVGIENFRPHDLRHTCTAWLVSAAVPLPEVRDVLGHSTIRMTERYAHLAPENIRAAVAKLDGHLHSDYSGEEGVVTGCATL